MKFVYPAQFDKQNDGGFVVTFRDFPEAITQGDDEHDAMSNATDCLDEAIAARIDDDEPVPAPSRRHAKERAVPLPVESAMKASLYMALQQQGLSKSALARLLEVDEKAARRLLDPHHSSKLPVMQRALRKLNVGVQVEFMGRG